MNKTQPPDSAAAEIRCPSCRKLLGKRLANWAVEAKYDRRITSIIVRGSLVCEPCGQSIPINTE